MLIPFLLISVSRFSETVEGTSWQTLNYAGQQIKSFNEYYQIDAPLQYGRGSLPVLVRAMEGLGLEVGSATEALERFSYYLRYDVEPWKFSDIYRKPDARLRKDRNVDVCVYTKPHYQKSTQESDKNGNFRLLKSYFVNSYISDRILGCFLLQAVCYKLLLDRYGFAFHYFQGVAFT